MRKIISLCVLLGGALTGLSQGTVTFLNNVAFATPDPTGGNRLVWLDAIGGTKLTGTQYTAELISGQTPIVYNQFRHRWQGSVLRPPSSPERGTSPLASVPASLFQVLMKANSLCSRSECETTQLGPCPTSRPLGFTMHRMSSPILFLSQAHTSGTLWKGCRRSLWCRNPLRPH